MTALATISNVSPIDRLGDIKAQIADLKAIEVFLIDEIKALGTGAYEGAAYRASVSQVAERTSADPKAMEAKLVELGVDGRWFSRNQKTTAGYTVVKVSARKA
jgi:Holliday junction resolvasome RuvABC ATP-dependent DNA helicase subunit